MCDLRGKPRGAPTAVATGRATWCVAAGPGKRKRRGSAAATTSIAQRIASDARESILESRWLRICFGSKCLVSAQK